MSERPLKVGTRVILRDKGGLGGVVAYVGLTEFSAGKWVGVILDEPKGKNNGTVQNKTYFQCAENCGTFVRQSQLALLDDDGNEERPSSRASSTTSIASSTSSTKGQSPKVETAPTTSSTPKPAAAPTKLATPRASASSIPKPGGVAATPTSSGGAGSRLPMPGKGPTGARSPSLTNLKAAKVKMEASTPLQTGLKKEQSFIEKDFQQTVASPSSFAPPSSSPMVVSAMSSPMVASTSSPMSERMEEKVAAAHAQQELLQSRDSIRDLEEKLETIRIKRAKDQEKLKEFEKMRIQHEQLLEFKTRIMDAQGQLQKELQKAKHEAREAIEAKEKHAEEMSDVSETVEMATLDKEMAEEKAEALQIELVAAKEKIEELTLDLDIIKAEVGDGSEAGKEGSVTHFEAKQQMAQNEKLRATLGSMRDLLAFEKNESMKMVKDLEEKTAQVADLVKANKKVAARNEELEATMSDLQEQVDAALGAEEMVENLTTKCLDMEDKLSSIVEEKEDLEKLHDLNEELQENAREVELQLREDLDLAHGKIREMARARDAAFEIIGDHEKTIINFRDHVKKVQEQNLDLRSLLEKETNKPVSTPAEMMSFKAMFAETKAHSKAIDMELRLCEERQAKQHVRYISSYMSDSFMMRGGDNDAVLTLLLVPRMIWKADILIGQIKEGFCLPLDSAIDKNALLKGHDVDRATFGNLLLYFLEALLTQLHQFSSALSTCSAETFLRVGTLYPEMSAHERSVDFYIDLLRKSQLDENVPIDNLEKGLQYFQNIYPLHLGTEKIDHPSFLRCHLRAVAAALEALGVDVVVGKILLAEGQTNSEIGTLLKTCEGEINQLKQHCKSMRRRLPNDDAVEALVSFPASTALKLSDVLKSLTPLVKVLHLFGRAAAQQAGLQGEAELNATKLAELLHQAIDKVYQFNDAGLDTLKSDLNSALAALAELSKKYQDGEWDVEMLTPKPQQPVVIRAETYKSELKEAESIKHKLEQKDDDIKEMKLILRSKGEELSEMQIRKDKAEKKLLDASRDSELVREKLQRKVDDLQVLLKKKEKDFEVTMEHLQSDIDQLEGEKGELKDKIKEYTKQTLFEKMNKNLAASSALAAGASGPGSMGPSVPMPVRDSPMLRQQLQELQTALLTLQENSSNRQSEALRLRMTKMKPLYVPKTKFFKGSADDKDEEGSKEKGDNSKEDEEDQNSATLALLMKRAQKLRADINTSLVSPKVVDLKKKTSAAEIMAQLMQRRNKQQMLQQEAEQLQLEVARLRASRRVGGDVHTEFVKFPSAQFSKALSEKEYTLVGKLRLPCTDKNIVQVKTVPLIVGLNELHNIHQTVFG